MAFYKRRNKRGKPRTDRSRRFLRSERRGNRTQVNRAQIEQSVAASR